MQVEDPVLAFSGDCANPVPRCQDSNRDVDRLPASMNPASSPDDVWHAGHGWKVRA